MFHVKVPKQFVTITLISKSIPLIILNKNRLIKNVQAKFGGKNENILGTELSLILAKL